MMGAQQLSGRVLDVRLYFSKNIVFFCLKIFFSFTSNVDPDEMLHNVAFDLGHNCFQKYLSRHAGIQKVLPEGVRLCNFFFLDERIQVTL